MSQFHPPPNRNKKTLTKEQEAKLEAFGSEATTSPGSINETSSEPKPNQNETTLEQVAESAPEEAATPKPAKAKSKGSTKKDSPGKADKPNRSFTVPLNDYELDLLRQLADQEDRSQRWIARKTLVGALESALKKR